MTLAEDEKFEWHCPRLGCKKQIVAYTKRGMELLADEHIYQHTKEDHANNLKPKINETQAYKSKDYDTLRLTRADIDFLKTRMIAIDDKIIREDNE
jgi:hypothetical protein